MRLVGHRQPLKRKEMTETKVTKTQHAYHVAYTVTKRDNVTIISGRVPALECVSILENASKQLDGEGVIDSKLAAHFNAVFVFGLEQDCNALRRDLNIT